MRPPLARCTRPSQKAVCPFFANPASEKKTLLEGSIVRKWVYTLSRPKGQRVNSGQGRRKAMLSHWSRILAASAAAVLFGSVHSIQAADFVGSVQGLGK